MKSPDMHADCFTGQHDLCNGRKCECWCHLPGGIPPAEPYPSKPALKEKPMKHVQVTAFGVAVVGSDLDKIGLALQAGGPPKQVFDLSLKQAKDLAEELLRQISAAEKKPA
jgi:hypothetical protein